MVNGSKTSCPCAGDDRSKLEILHGRIRISKLLTTSVEYAEYKLLRQETRKWNVSKHKDVQAQLILAMFLQENDIQKQIGDNMGKRNLIGTYCS